MRPAFPTFLVPGMSFVEDSFSTDLDRGKGMVWGRFQHIILLHTLFLLLLHQLHLKSSGFRSRRLETPAPDRVGTLVSERNGDPVEGFEQRHDHALTRFRGMAVLSMFCRRATVHPGSPDRRLRHDRGMRWRLRPGRSLWRSLMRSDLGYTLKVETN